MPKAKHTVSINTGALVIVEIEGAQYKYRCSEESSRSGRTVSQVVKSLQDCVHSSVASATKLHKSKKAAK